MMREAQPLNVVNIEGILEELIPYRFFNNEKAVRWIRTSVKRAITNENNWKADCAYLGITTSQCMTAREAQLLNMLSEALPVSNLPRANYIGRILTQNDYLMYPWLAEAVIRGDTLIMMNISENAKNTIDHLCEVVIERFPRVEDPAVLSLSQVRAESARWQLQLEREAEKAEGHVAHLGKMRDGHDVWLLLDKQAFLREGKTMHHCVGSYVPVPGLAILSIRDEDESIATVELRVHRKKMSLGDHPLIGGDLVDIVQVRGPKNASVTKELKDNFMEFLRGMCEVRRTEEDAFARFGDLVQQALGVSLGGDRIGLIDGNGIIVRSDLITNRSLRPGDVLRISDLLADDGSALENSQRSWYQMAMGMMASESVAGLSTAYPEPLYGRIAIDHTTERPADNRPEAGGQSAGNDSAHGGQEKSSGQ